MERIIWNHARRIITEDNCTRESVLMSDINFRRNIYIYFRDKREDFYGINQVLGLPTTDICIAHEGAIASYRDRRVTARLRR